MGLAPIDPPYILGKIVVKWIGCHCWLVQQCGETRVGKPSVATGAGQHPLFVPRVKSASNEMLPAPTNNRNSKPIHMAKSVRASCIMLQNP